MILLSLCGFISCQHVREDQTNGASSITTIKPTDIPVKYSNIFHITNYGTYQEAIIENPWNAKEIYAKYLLVPKTEEVPDNLAENTILVRTPIENIITLSSTHIGLIALLNEEEKITGHSNLGFVSNQLVRNNIEAGKVIEVGDPQNLNIEFLVDNKPELLMVSGFEKIHDNFKLAEKADIPIAYNIEWMETSPLARAEWIKFIAAFFNKSAMADSVFNEIETQYLAAKKLGNSALTQPKVMVGSKFNGTWFMPGGKSYMASFLKDAGADYYWQNDTTRGSLPLSFEEVLDKNLDADIWLNPGAASTISDILKQDARYEKFAPLAQENIYNNINKVTPLGGNDYWESGMANPHLILKDIIKILHPELLPEYKLVYYKKLTKG
ncbi:ABC transporter substrate-binding protein [Chondrinema litorale]|uniref:ABC transporter substrate-binding protein n=1 Tax=Chondrinema litorale TaxID=2994555 RepID=UPI002542F1F7|nr:ABC transporter substrate-binding protein [Chondrinema litorale]UZR99780.1 ABC transporter substrate-binding protein [Chondrinema litorale]